MLGYLNYSTILQLYVKQLKFNLKENIHFVEVPFYLKI